MGFRLKPVLQTAGFCTFSVLSVVHPFRCCLFLRPFCAIISATGSARSGSRVADQVRVSVAADFFFDAYVMGGDRSGLLEVTETGPTEH